MTNKDKVIIYVKTKNSKKAEKVKEKLEKHCIKQNYEIVGNYLEGKNKNKYEHISNPISRKFNKDNEKLILASKQRNANIVLVWELSQLGKTTTEILHKIYFISSKNKVVEVVRQKLGNKIKLFDFFQKIEEFIVPRILPNRKVLYRRGEPVSILEDDAFSEKGEK